MTNSCMIYIVLKCVKTGEGLQTTSIYVPYWIDMLYAFDIIIDKQYESIAVAKRIGDGDSLQSNTEDNIWLQFIQHGHAVYNLFGDW